MISNAAPAISNMRGSPAPIIGGVATAGGVAGCVLTVIMITQGTSASRWRGGITRGSTTKGVIPATRGVITRGVITRGVLTCGRLSSETSLLFHSHEILPGMVRPTPDTGGDSKDRASFCIAAERLPVGHEVALALAQLPSWNVLLLIKYLVYLRNLFRFHWCGRKHVQGVYTHFFKRVSGVREPFCDCTPVLGTHCFEFESSVPNTGPRFREG